MGDRASELRAMMKAKSAGGALTGKDKAKYLKSLREGQKAESRPVPAQVIPNSQMPSAAAETLKATCTMQVRVVSIPALAAVPTKAAPKAIVPNTSSAAASSSAMGGLVGYDDDDDDEDEESSASSSSSAPPAGFFDEEPSSSSAPPAGFFDEEPSSVPKSQREPSSVPKSQKEVSKEKKEHQYMTAYDYDKAPYEKIAQPQVQQSRVNAAEEYAEQLLAEASANSVIPRGFFDDPLADLKARGVDIKKIEKKQEKREEEELKSFLGAIEVIQDDDGGLGLEKEEEDEEKEKLIDEEMMQLTYQRKMAVLMHQSERVLALKRSRIENDEGEDDDDEEEGEGKGEGEGEGQGEEEEGDVEKGSRMRRKALKTISKSISTSSSSSSISSSEINTINQNKIDMEAMILETDKDADAILLSILGPDSYIENTVENTLEHNKSNENSMNRKNNIINGGKKTNGENGNGMFSDNANNGSNGSIGNSGNNGNNGDIVSKKMTIESTSRNASSSISSVKYEVAQLLRRKKEENKRRQEEALMSDYNPLDFMDWTARSL